MTSTYTWRNLPLDVGHVLAYFVAHEAHHRGQIVLVARALGHRLPPAVTAGLWQWTKRAAEARSAAGPDAVQVDSHRGSGPMAASPSWTFDSPREGIRIHGACKTQSRRHGHDLLYRTQ